MNLYLFFVAGLSLGILAGLFIALTMYVMYEPWEDEERYHGKHL